MTTPDMIRFVEQRPFEPFTIVTVDGRELHAPHPEYVNLGLRAMSVRYLHPTGQVEVVDAALIVSLRTIYAADDGNYAEPPDAESE